MDTNKILLIVIILLSAAEEVGEFEREYEVACGISPFFYYICETHKKS